MSNHIYEDFIKNSQTVIHNGRNNTIAQVVHEQYKSVLKNAASHYKKYDLAKHRAFFAKNKVLHDLDNYIIDFERNFTENGGKLLYAEDEENALKEVLKILKNTNSKNILLSNSLTIEEIGLQKFFEEKNKEYTETEWNKYIGQLNKTPRNKFNYPILTLPIEKALKIIETKFSLNDMDMPSILDFVKKNFINKANQEAISITGANFLVADCGGVALCENQGNIAIDYSFPTTHIVVVGIDKLIPTLQDLELFVSLLSTHSAGKEFPYNQSLLLGPKRANEIDGPSQMYVILIDNGRSEALRHLKLNKTFACIHCGACSAVCPVYKYIGYDSEKTGYQSPIENIKAPFTYGFSYTSHLSYACTLCGKCSEVCPVSIPLPELILQNRKLSAEKSYFTSIDSHTIKKMKKMFLKRKNLESTYTRFILKHKFKNMYGNQRVFPDFKKKSFNMLYKEINGDSQ
ncbi:MAG: LUD domain-containing protein [Bacteroidales bacterium]